jgi:hypothetical protein
MITLPKRTAIIVILASAYGASTHAVASQHIAEDQRAVTTAIVERDARRSVSIERRPAGPLRIANVRLDSAPLTEQPSARILRFDLVNEGPKHVTDPLVEVLILEKPASEQVPAPRRVVAGPFMISGNVLLHSGYTLSYEMLLRNLTSDCRCVAQVHVISAPSVPDSGS